MAPEEQSLLSLSLAVNVIINGALCVLGYVGNILTIVALSKDKVYNSNILLMQVLAGYDIFFLTHTLLYTVLRSVYPATGALQAYHDKSPYIIAFVLPFGWIAQTGTIWFTTALAADRYIGITRPFKALTLCTLQNTRKVVIGLSIGAFLFNFPRFFYYFNVAVNSDNNSTFIAHVRVELPGFDANIYRYVYHITLTFIFLYIIPLTSLTVLNYKLIKTLRTASITRKRMSMSRAGSPTNKQNLTITLNLVIVITKFILCETPDFISSIVGAIPESSNKTEYKMFNTIKEMLLVFNSAVNFYIYCIFNIKFRENLQRAFPCFRKDNLGMDRLASTSSSTLNVSLSSLSLAISAFKGKRTRATSTCTTCTTPDSTGPPRPSYGRNRNYSESSGELLSPNGVTLTFDPRRDRLDSMQSDLTVLTAASSEVNHSIGTGLEQSENEDYVVFKPHKSSIKKYAQDMAPSRACVLQSPSDKKSNFRRIRAYCEQLVAWRQFYEQSDNPEYIIFKSKQNGVRERHTISPVEELRIKEVIHEQIKHDISYDLSLSLEGSFMIYDAEDIAAALGESEDLTDPGETTSKTPIEHIAPEINQEKDTCKGQEIYPEGVSCAESTQCESNVSGNKGNLPIKARVKYPTFPNLLYADMDETDDCLTCDSVEKPLDIDCTRDFVEKPHNIDCLTPDSVEKPLDIDGLTRNSVEKPRDIEDISIEIKGSTSTNADVERGLTIEPQKEDNPITLVNEEHSAPCSMSKCDPSEETDV